MPSLFHTCTGNRLLLTSESLYLLPDVYLPDTRVRLRARGAFVGCGITSNTIPRETSHSPMTSRDFDLLEPVGRSSAWDVNPVQGSPRSCLTNSPIFLGGSMLRSDLTQGAAIYSSALFCSYRKTCHRNTKSLQKYQG